MVDRPPVPRARKVSLGLMWHPALGKYEVKQISGTTYYRPGEELTPDVVEKCCALQNWTVAMVSSDFIQTLLGTVSEVSKLPIPLP